MSNCVVAGMQISKISPAVFVPPIRQAKCETCEVLGLSAGMSRNLEPSAEAMGHVDACIPCGDNVGLPRDWV